MERTSKAIYALIGTLGVSALTAVVVASGNSRIPDWIETPKSTFLVLPPTLITDGNVEKAEWATDGKYLLVAERERSHTLDSLLPSFDESGMPKPLPKTPLDLLIWDRKSDQVRKVWSTDEKDVWIGAICWLHDSPEVLIALQTVSSAGNESYLRSGLLAINAGTGETHWVAGCDNLADRPDIEPSPSMPKAVIGVSTYIGGPPTAGVNAPATALSSEFKYVAIDANGRVTQTAPASFAGHIEWSPDGREWYYWTPTGRRDRRYYRLLSNGQSEALESEPAVYVAKETNPDLWVATQPTFVRKRTAKKSLFNLWLSSPVSTHHPDAFLTPDGKLAKLSPRDDGVFYVDGGIAKVRVLAKLSDEQRKALVSAVKSALLSQVKQVGLGLMMYGADADDQLPGSGAFGDGIMPYLKDGDLLDGFVYTPPGNLNLTQIGSPAETEIGYVDGPGGRAVVYADGHAKWLPSP